MNQSKQQARSASSPACGGGLGRGWAKMRAPSLSLQPKSDVSDFGQSIKRPNSDKPEFGCKRGRDDGAPPVIIRRPSCSGNRSNACWRGRRKENMRSKIEATWVVGHERGHHTLIRDGEVVFEDNRILHVGKGFEG